MKKTPKTSTPDTGKPLRIKSAAALQALIRKPFLLPFAMHGQMFELELMPLLEEEVARVNSVMQELGVPPYRAIKGEGGRPVRDAKGEAKEDYDYNDKAWLEKRDVLLKEQRSLRIYLGCPAVRADKPALTNRAEIHDYVKSLWSENLLETVSLMLQTGGLQEIAERTNFTIGGGSGN